MSDQAPPPDGCAYHALGWCYFLSGALLLSWALDLGALRTLAVLTGVALVAAGAMAWCWPRPGGHVDDEPNP